MINSGVAGVPPAFDWKSHPAQLPPQLTIDWLVSRGWINDTDFLIGLGPLLEYKSVFELLNFNERTP